jgi:hypothetical protein
MSGLLLGSMVLLILAVLMLLGVLVVFLVAARHDVRNGKIRFKLTKHMKAEFSWNRHMD